MKSEEKQQKKEMKKIIENTDNVREAMGVHRVLFFHLEDFLL